MSFDPILVAVDFSSSSLAAARRACSLAGPSGTVLLLSAVDSESVLARTHFAAARDILDELFATFEAETRRRLEDLARDLAPPEHGPGPRIETRVARGRPADVIVEAAERAGLVVLGAHGQGTLQRALLGSTAEEVVRRSPVPTLIVREGAEGTEKVQRVLLAVDTDEPSDDAIHAAGELARRTGARLEAVHVIPWPTNLPQVPVRAETFQRALEDVQQRVRAEAPRAVRALVSRAIGLSPEVHVLEGAAATAIVEIAHPTDVLVCGTHGRGVLGRLAFGSVATKLVRRAPCPVLVARPRSARSQ